MTGLTYLGISSLLFITIHNDVQTILYPYTVILLILVQKGLSVTLYFSRCITIIYSISLILKPMFFESTIDPGQTIFLNYHTKCMSS